MEVVAGSSAAVREHLKVVITPLLGHLHLLEALFSLQVGRSHHVLHRVSDRLKEEVARKKRERSLESERETMWSSKETWGGGHACTSPNTKPASNSFRHATEVKAMLVAMSITMILDRNPM